MPMNPAKLGTDISTALKGLSEAEKKDVDAIWKKIASLIITHITTSATITTPQGPGTIT